MLSQPWLSQCHSSVAPPLHSSLSSKQAHYSITKAHNSTRTGPYLVWTFSPGISQLWHCPCHHNIQCCGSAGSGLERLEPNADMTTSASTGKTQARAQSRRDGSADAANSRSSQHQQASGQQSLMPSRSDLTSQTSSWHPPPSMHLPDAYTTVLAPSPTQSPSTSTAHSLRWTHDDRLEAADREAIRRAEAARLASHTDAQAQLPPAPTIITRLPSHIAPEVLDNAMALVDKPLLWEDEEVARTLRWALPVDRLGYVEALEPGATGLMLLLIGKATALTSMMSGLGSRYTATVRMGVSTDTHDSAGRMTDLGPWQHVTDDQIQQVALQLTGRHIQVPPALSAVHVKGKPVYELAKKRPMKDMVPRPVTITQLALERVEPGGRDLHMDVTFARFGYVRSLVHEIGQRLHCGAHVTQMRRVAVGEFSVDNAWTLDILLPVARKFGKESKKRMNN